MRGIWREQACRVGVAGAAGTRRPPSLLHQPPGVHHHDPVGGGGHNAEIVGDEQDRPVQVTADPGEGLQHLGLHGDVQRRGRLIGDQHPGLQRHRHGDHDPLAHPAGEFVGERVGAPIRRRDSHKVQQVHRRRLRMARGTRSWARIISTI